VSYILSNSSSECETPPKSGFLSQGVEFNYWNVDPEALSSSAYVIFH